MQTVTDTFFSHENNLFERLFSLLDAGDVLLAESQFLLLWQPQRTAEQKS